MEGEGAAEGSDGGAGRVRKEVTLEDARAWLAALAEAQPALVAEAPPRGLLRGIDVYREPDHLLRVVARALAIHYGVHGRYPDPKRLERTADCYFVEKFYGRFPMSPNPADKLNAELWLPKAVAGDVRIAHRPWVSGRAELPADAAVPRGRWVLKAAIGNAMHRRVVWPPAAAERSALETLVTGWFEGRYGVRWGEWWYAVGPQRVFLEEDLTEARAGQPEFKLYTRDGRVVLIRAVFHRKEQKLPTAERFFDGAFEPIEGQSVGYDPLAIPVPASAERMLRVAAAIGARFERVRVDFMHTGDETPWLNELTIGDVNARRIHTPPALEAEARRLLFG